MTVFHLIRHAEYDALGHGVLTGRQAGHALNAAGVAQAGALAAAMARLPLLAVLTSPVQRARETAGPVARAHRLDADEDAAFAEIDFGAWTGRTVAGLDGDPAWRLWNTARGIAATPGGEAMAAVQARAVAGLRHIFERIPDAEVAVVSHADVIRAVLCTALGMPLDLLLRLTVDPASRSIVRLHAHGTEVIGLNLPAS